MRIDTVYEAPAIRSETVALQRRLGTAGLSSLVGIHVDLISPYEMNYRAIVLSDEAYVRTLQIANLEEVLLVQEFDAAIAAYGLDIPVLDFPERTRLEIDDFRHDDPRICIAPTSIQALTQAVGVALSSNHLDL